MSRITLISAVILSVMFSVGAVQAATVNFTDNLGTLGAKTSGTFSGPVLANATGTVDTLGYIPADSKIVITYTLTPQGASNLLNSAYSTSTSSYSYYVGTGRSRTRYYGNAHSTATLANPNGTPYSMGYQAKNGVVSPSVPLVMAAAHITGNTATATIFNYSSSTASFAAILTIFRSLSGALGVSYNVSAVPLPAALPLFAMAFAGLAFLGYRSRKA